MKRNQLIIFFPKILKYSHKSGSHFSVLVIKKASSSHASLMCFIFLLSFFLSFLSFFLPITLNLNLTYLCYSPFFFFLYLSALFVHYSVHLYVFSNVSSTYVTSVCVFELKFLFLFILYHLSFHYDIHHIIWGWVWYGGLVL